MASENDGELLAFVVHLTSHVQETLTLSQVCDERIEGRGADTDEKGSRIYGREN